MPVLAHAQPAGAAHVACPAAERADTQIDLHFALAFVAQPRRPHAVRLDGPEVDEDADQPRTPAAPAADREILRAFGLSLVVEPGQGEGIVPVEAIELIG